MSMPAKYPQWAVNDVIDPTSGQPNVSDPDTSDPSKKLLGWDFKEYPPRQWFNYLHRLVNDWIEYVNGDLFGNALGSDVREVMVSQLSSYDALSTDLNIVSTDDMDIYSNDQMDIAAINNLVVEGGEVWIDSANWLYLLGAYEIDIDAGDYLLMTAGTLTEISSSDITLLGVTDIKGMGGSAGLRLHTGKVMREYIEGGFVAPAVTGSGGFTWVGDWFWEWRRHDNILDLVIPGIAGTVTSAIASWVFVGVPPEIIDGYSLNLQSYERSSAQSITFVPLHAGVNAYRVEMTQFSGLNPNTINFTFDQPLQVGAANIGKMFFRYEARD